MTDRSRAKSPLFLATMAILALARFVAKAQSDTSGETTAEKHFGPVLHDLLEEIWGVKK